MNLVCVKHSNFIEKYIENYTSEHTRRAYQKDLTDFFEFLKFTPTHPSQLDVTYFVDYKNYLVGKNLTPATINRKFSTIRSLMNWCIVNGFISNNPIESVKLPRTTTTQPTIAFTDEEVVRMLNAPDICTFNGNTHRLVLCLLFQLGLRRSELVGIKLKDIYQDRGHTVLRIFGKGGKVRQLPLNGEVLVYFKSYLLNHTQFSGTNLNQEDYLIQSYLNEKNFKSMNPNNIFKIVNRYAKRLGIEKRVGAHSCRATAISHLLDTQKIPIRDVADFAGHQNITTTSSYDKKRKGLDDSAAYAVNYKENNDETSAVDNIYARTG